MNPLDVDDSFMDMGPTYPFMGLTENMSATYMSSTNPCLDFFFHVVPNTPAATLHQRLKLSWDHDPLTTLKLVCNLRAVRGTGKSDRESFYTAALWMHQYHPKTLACNLRIFADFGYFKDLLEILYRLIEGPDIRIKQKTEWTMRKLGKKGRARRRSSSYFGNEDDPVEMERKKMYREKFPREERIQANIKKVKVLREIEREFTKRKWLNVANKASEKYEQDANFRFLHDQIAALFAQILKSDIELLKSGEIGSATLAGKWCPTVDSSFDRSTLICKSIARRMFPRESSPEYEGLDEDQYNYKVKDRLRKEVLVPLHQALKLPEVYMSAKQWNLIAYNRVASVALKNYTNIFLNRDAQRFDQYLEDVKTGKAKITAGALLPHEIIRNLEGRGGEPIVAELQWKRVVDNSLAKGKLTNCLAICDVSGSMHGTPMEVAVALGLLVSELCEEPWKGHVLTFSQSPQLHLIIGADLMSKTEFIRRMEWGMNTDFQKAFDKILEFAVDPNLPEEKMIKTVFVFSDMEFDEASANPWETDYMVIQRKFKENGYQNVPDIVFWNLRDSSATPVTAKENGVALLSGFSKNLLTIFLEQGGDIKAEDAENSVSEDVKREMNPEAAMESAISGELYEKLVVYD